MNGTESLTVGESLSASKRYFWLKPSSMGVSSNEMAVTPALKYNTFFRTCVSSKIFPRLWCDKRWFLVPQDLHIFSQGDTCLGRFAIQQMTLGMHI